MDTDSNVKIIDITTYGQPCRKASWYVSDKGSWDYVARLNDPSLAAVLVSKMNIALNNHNIIYFERNHESQRDELYDFVKAGGDIATLNTTKHCDCSALVSALLLYCGIDIGCANTASMYKGFCNKDVTVFSNYNITNHAEYLKVGDIVWRSKDLHPGGHAMTVVYSNYDIDAPEYEDIPLVERNINYGRLCVQSTYVSDGASIRDTAPSDLNELSDMELFILGAMITGGEAILIEGGASSVVIK